jgi:hypothetical protein
VGYEWHKKEVLEQLAALPGVEERARDSARRALESFYRQREGRLENLLELLEPGKEPRQRAWVEQAQKSAAWAMEELGRVNALGTRAWLARVAFQEHGFFVRIGHSAVPAQRDRMVVKGIQLEKAMKEFDRKWQTIRDKDASLDAKMKSAAEQYEELLVEAAHAAAEAEKESREKLASQVKDAVRTASWIFDFGVIEKILSAAATVIALKLDKSKERKHEIFALLSLEEQVLHSFREGREVVAEFLEEHDFPKLKAAWADGDEAAGKLEGRMPTEGLKRDAAEFAKAMRAELQKVFGEAEKHYREFARRHQYLFFGPLGDGYVKELTEIDQWKSWTDDWNDVRKDFDDLLRARFLKAREDNVLDVDLRGLSRTDRLQVYNQLKGACERLLQVWNKFKEANDDPYAILKSREKMQEKLERS